MAEVIIRALRMATRAKGYKVYVGTPRVRAARMVFEGELAAVLGHAVEELVDFGVPAHAEVTFIFEAKTWWKGRLDWLSDASCQRSIAKLVESRRREPWHHEAP